MVNEITRSGSDQESHGWQQNRPQAPAPNRLQVN